jgi:hypothetical protein
VPVEDAGRENMIRKVKSCHVAAYLNSIFLCLIPVDGLIARGDYEHEFTLNQFTILPGGGAQKFKITQFDKIKMA